jgi:VIT1/CCC1 family predicted Fe2+/Mn2+ transporter
MTLQSRASSSAPKLRELSGTYISRGLCHTLPDQVARKVMVRHALGAHAHDKLGLSNATAEPPSPAAPASAASFSIGAVLPIATLAGLPTAQLIRFVNPS